MGRVNMRVRAATRLVPFCGASAIAIAIALTPRHAAWAEGTRTAAPVAASSSASTTLVSQIAAHLGQQSGIRAQFIQTRTLAAMKAPLVSHGSLLFYRERGVIWQLDTPYKATYVITDAGVRQLGPDGQPGAAPNPQGARSAQTAAKLMRDMLSGDLSALYSQFDVHADGTPSRWHMLLTPNQPQLAQSIKSLQMSGGTYLQTLLVTLANGDATALSFEGTSAVTTLTPAEAALFGVH